MNFSWRTYSILLLIILISYYSSAIDIFQDDLDISKLENIFRSLGPSKFRNGMEKYNISNPCFREYFHFIMDLMEMEPWTLKMIDASSKIPNGILTGHIFDLGMFDECLSVQENKYGREMRGRHCIYSLKLKSSDFSSVDVNLVPKLSICVPATCNNEDVTHILKLAMFNMTNISQFGLSDVTAACSNTDPPRWTTADVTVSSLMGIYVLFLICCTTFDILENRMNLQNKLVQLLSKFSMRRSALQIFNMKINPKSFPALNGIRALSIIWIVLGHEYLFGASTFLHINNLEIVDWISSWKSLHIFIAPFAVDTFFTLSGFLMAYLFIKEISRGRKFNIFGYYLHRYIRLTPAVVALLLVSIFIIPHLGWGPLWDTTVNGFLCEKCKEKWWPHLLYVHNYVMGNNTCLKHLWYLAVDMQLFWTSPIILYPLCKKPKLGFLIFGLCFMISTIMPAVVVASNRYPITLLEGGSRGAQSSGMFNDLYASTYTRANAWLVGVILGYFVAKETIKLNKVEVLVGWIVAVLCFAFCTLSYRNLQGKDHVYNVFWESTLAAICRPIWASGVAWIIFASIAGFGGPVTKFLSLPIFLPLSKISYCIYLVHMVVQNLRISALKTALYFSDFEVFTSFLSTLVMTLVASFFFSLFFESPVLVLEKIIFRREKKADKIVEANTSNGNGITSITK